MARLGILATALALALTACTASERQPPTSAPPDTPAQTQPGATSTSLIALPQPTGGLEGGIVLSCGGSGPSFPASALSSTTSLDEPAYAFVADAMESFLSSEEGAFWPQDGWRVLHETEGVILVVHIAELQGQPAVSFMTVGLRDGLWRWEGSQAGGPCELTTIPPERLNRVNWRLDPQFEVDGSFIELPLLVTELECASGQPMGDRLLPPEVVETADAVYIAFAAVPDEADAHTCQGNPETAVVVPLEMPLGDRELKDGMKLAGFLSDYIGDDFGLPS